MARHSPRSKRSASRSWKSQPAADHHHGRSYRDILGVSEVARDARAGPREADLTLLTASYEPPKNRGKGRLVRDANGQVLRIVEQRDIDAIPDNDLRRALLDTTEGNCPLYAIRAATLRRHLSGLTNDNAQGQYYITDIVEASAERVATSARSPRRSRIRSTTCSVPTSLGRWIWRCWRACWHLRTLVSPLVDGSDRRYAQTILADRPTGQVAAIASQLEELVETAAQEQLGFRDDQPVGIGISGGRVRIAFMHPDMGRFFGPAWQMPFGARDASGREQIVMLVQSSDDGKIHLYPTNPQFREKLNSVPADNECMYPGDEVADWYSYEGFGTRMAENLLLSLGYFSDEELASCAGTGSRFRRPSLWISNSMRRPFSLIGNAIASMRTLRTGTWVRRCRRSWGATVFAGCA